MGHTEQRDYINIATCLYIICDHLLFHITLFQVDNSTVINFQEAPLYHSIIALSLLEIHHKSVHGWHWCLIAIHSFWAVFSNSFFLDPMRCWNMACSTICPFCNHKRKSWQLSYISLLRKMLSNTLNWLNSMDSKLPSEAPFSHFPIMLLILTFLGLRHCEVIIKREYVG